MATRLLLCKSSVQDLAEENCKTEEKKCFSDKVSSLGGDLKSSFIE